MKLRTGLVLLTSAALLAAGCGSDSKDSKKDEKPSAADKVTQAKLKSVSDAEKAFKKDSKNVDLCRNLAMSYVALASPESTGDPKKAPKQPKDREKNLEKSTKTLEECTKIAPKDRNVQQMLASTLMATGDYKGAAPILKQLAQSAKGAEAANAYYAWGLAASNAQDVKSAIAAWQKFVELSPAKDQRVPQVRQSIKALQASLTAQAAAKTAAADTPAADDTKTGDDTASDSNGDDSGGDDE